MNRLNNLKSGHVLDEESKFELHEMFVSRTDKRGQILSGNDVFVRVSGYTREQLIGSPHNIIRHPDMPRSVFKLLWDRLGQGKSVIAYVKNRSIDGKYYWVLATVFPVKDGYLSIRLKPSPKIVAIVNGVYQKALKLEKNLSTGELNKGIEFILKELSGLGFSDYDQFSVWALGEELKTRDENCTTKGLLWNADRKNRVDRLLSEMTQLAIGSAEGLEKVAVPLRNFADFKKRGFQFSNDIDKVCVRLENLSVNMAVTAHKLGEDGGALAVIAASFQASAQKMLQTFSQFKTEVDQVSIQIESQSLQALVSRVQIEMLAFIFHEIRDVATKHSTLDISTYAEISTLIYQLSELVSKSTNQMGIFAKAVRSLQKKASHLDGNVMQMDLIRLGGKLEGSRTSSIASAFGPFISEMQKFTHDVRTPVTKLVEMLDQLEGAVSGLESQLKLTEFGVDELKVTLNYMRPHGLVERTA